MNKDSLDGRCVKCIHFQSGYEKGYGSCWEERAFKEIYGKTFQAGAANGPCPIRVRRLDGCSYWKKAW